MPATEASAQKAGGVLKVYNRDSPASMSILEEATLSTVLSMMGVFNNLVVYDQHVAQNSEQSIVPELATDWSWSEDGTRLTFKLREGVKWHDGKPFTARDVKCTWDLLTGKANDRPRRSRARRCCANRRAKRPLSSRYPWLPIQAGRHCARRGSACRCLTTRSRRSRRHAFRADQRASRLACSDRRARSSPTARFRKRARRLDGRIDIVSIGLGDRRDRLSCRRIENIEPLTRFGVDPVAVDQQLVFAGEKGRSGRTQPRMQASRMASSTS
jgi:hypothetical protein